ncbi:DUF302 domain-containing protein [Thiocapsa marina]|uniref:DUF302 domain-containing protein n=1 Tax=Thiocapsa marina 5811 TaxID=768671 RepID=F9U859_9GAMM|nr:DUF302 domain-containing protein [Thiocapsa marina]EGV19471.1 protein of unknown function DUF302 [Thiocapsa marina 5811]
MSTRYNPSVSFVVLFMLLGGCSMGSLFIHEQRSPYDFDTTVAKVVENAQAEGWIVPKIFDFQKSLVDHRQRDPGRMKVIKICSPELASRMFADDDSKFVSVMAPCSISVYEKADGSTYLAAMDMALMSKLMGGNVGPVLADIAAEDAAILRFASGDP